MVTLTWLYRLAWPLNLNGGRKFSDRLRVYARSKCTFAAREKNRANVMKQLPFRKAFVLGVAAFAGAGGTRQ